MSHISQRSGEVIFSEQVQERGLVTVPGDLGGYKCLQRSSLKTLSEPSKS